MSERSGIPEASDAGPDALRRSWNAVLLFGLALIITGSVCILAASTTTLATVLVFGSLLLIGAAISLIHAFQSRKASSFFLHLLRVVLRGVTGFLLIRYPLAGAMSLTLILALFFLVGGIFRAIGTAALQLPGWGWGALAGILSMALGIVVLLQLPSLSIWFIGFAIGVDLIFDGVGLAVAGLALDRFPSSRTFAGI